MRQCFLVSTLVGLLSTLLLTSSLVAAEEPATHFLDSYVIVRPGILDLGTLTVDAYTEVLEANVLDDGSHPSFLGWSIDGNRHTAHFRFIEKDVELVFVHQRADEARQSLSLLEPIDIEGRRVDAYTFSLLFF